MAGSVGNDSFDDDSPISEINVTPFVDVVLVLLVIFMVTAPTLMKDAIAVKLPKSSTSDTKVLQTLGVAVSKDGVILVNGLPATEETLKVEAKKVLAQSPEATAVIGADQDAKHGDVVRAIDWVKAAGIEKFALQIERKSGGATPSEPSESSATSAP
jgi:biopolymer transport protein ExbD